jgi:hypothetical protein
MFTLRSLFLVIAGVALFCGGWAAARINYDAALRQADKVVGTLATIERDTSTEMRRVKAELWRVKVELRACEDGRQLQVER